VGLGEGIQIHPKLPKTVATKSGRRGGQPLAAYDFLPHDELERCGSDQFLPWKDSKQPEGFENILP
jgi:hypothetical protein